MISDQLERLWTRTLASVEREVPKPSFETFVRPTHPVAFLDDTLIVGVPNEVARQQVESKFSHLLHRTLNLLGGVNGQTNVTLRFVITSGPRTPAALPQRPEPELRDAPSLNPKYTFDAFVVGNSNRFAHAAARAVAQMPARAYNPLFIYGGVGLGKTHLMLAIGNHICRESPRLRVLYVQTETFTNELINAIRDDHTVEFRNRYRTMDILLIDDIQFLSGKERTQEEFFHTFEALHGASRQIVISSDRPPKEILTLEERLRSRFEWGLIADMQAPDLETRIAILRKKAQMEQLEVPDETIAYIASKIEKNIRELEGALIRVVAQASLQHIEPTPENAIRILKDILPNAKPRPLTIPLIQEAVADYYGLKMDDMSTKTRTRALAFPRQVAMYLVRELTDCSLPRIGEAFGGRDHTTVIHACDKIISDMGHDPALRGVIEELTARIMSPVGGSG